METLSPEASDQPQEIGRRSSRLESFENYHSPEPGSSSDGHSESKVSPSGEQASSISAVSPSVGEDDDSAAQRDEHTNITAPSSDCSGSESTAREDWEYRKTTWGESNNALDELMDMVGIEEIKRKFLQLHTLIQTAGRQGLDHISEKFGAVFIGNPGTGLLPGKSKIAMIYAKYLYDTDNVPSNSVTRITGSRLASRGVRGCKSLLAELQTDDGGVFLVEEAHQLMRTRAGTACPVLDYIMSEVENLKGEVVFLFTGHGKQMEALCAYYPGFLSLIPTVINFPDYLDHDLHLLLIREVNSRFGEEVIIQGGYDGRLMKIVARRIGRGRGRHGFGNARDVETAVAKIHSRQADRLFRSMKDRSHCKSDDLVLSQEDLLGPPPLHAFKSRAWDELKAMIGLSSVKNSIEAMIHRLQLNYQRELAEMPLLECSLNKLLLGNPGTGKTTVAKLYGQILSDIGLLSDGEVVIKTPSDLLGDALGQSETNTKAVLDYTKGKVLIIDEAYMLGHGDKSTPTHDPYRTGVIDTIIGEVQSTAVEDRCVLLVGYQDRMESMLNDVNPALARRFPLASAFTFEDYSQDELKQILGIKLSAQGLRASKEAMDTALEVLARTRNRPGFGNAGEVDIILDQAKLRQHSRLLSDNNMDAEIDLLLPHDIDPDFERGTHSLLNIRALFNNFVGNEAVIKQMENYQVIARNMKTLSQRVMDGSVKGLLKDPRDIIPFTFIFCGPPGTGKTTTANRMGELFYDMGFLASKDVIECSATDLIGEYVGHTGPKTKRLFDTALGRVLLIDEAYKLAEGPFSKEAVIEMINNLTRRTYQNKLVVILAGYEHDIDKLMSINPGLSSRFPVVIRFSNLSVGECVDLLLKCLREFGLDTSSLGTLEHCSSGVGRSFKRLSTLPSWGNARDIQTIAKMILSRLLESNTPIFSLAVTESLIDQEITAMINDRQMRTATVLNSEDAKMHPATLSPNDFRKTRMIPSIKMKAKTNMTTSNAVEQGETLKALQDICTRIAIPRDKYSAITEGRGTQSPSKKREREPEVSDEIWQQLESDKRAAKKRKMDCDRLSNVLARVSGEISNAKAAIARAPAGSEIAKRAENRLRVAEEKHEKHRVALEEKEKEETLETEAQELLKDECPLGFAWIRQESGYRCAGGSHYATFEQIRAGRISKEEIATSGEQN
ncbi:P-loop containing nucleoside triphosphate hydrolase protein [Nemania sp. FL0916]|nr:P-loop containing nucleoside triphosphate hydrolase protein [Nemania sp. FL0916]